ncbi:MAG: hypothetical protein KF861_23135, partial [Planctomycetaceae bacterium]|nr:hypothetical protein [Planctomycetaceae bacterium]
MHLWSGVAGCWLCVALLGAFAAKGLAGAEQEPAEASSISPVSREYREHWTALLKEGFTRNTGSLQVAEQRYRAAKLMRPDDPALDYAYGLVLLKQAQLSGAVSQFAQA